MRTIHRNYSEEAGDFARICALITGNPATARARSTITLGRLVDWKYAQYEGKRSFRDFCEENAHLWFDGFGGLAGFVFSEGGDGGFLIFTLEGYAFLYEEMLGWALETFGGREACLSTELTENQPYEAEILRKNGFVVEGPIYTRWFDLTGELAPHTLLEPGFTIVDMHAHPDYRAQGILRADAFQGKHEITEEELQYRLKYYNNSLNGPIYHPNTDLCVMAPDGRFVAGCEALIDARNAQAEIERVCTHSLFRKRGFARAVIQECLSRLKEIGLRSASITGYSAEAIALYGSLGAKAELRSYAYELPVSPVAALP